MKKWLLGISSIIMIACGDKENKENINPFADLNISVDTVMVDPGDEILYLRDNLWLSSLSPDGKYLFNFNRNDAVLEKIDLDNLTLVKKIQFEKEGPDGIGPMVSKLSVTLDGNIMMWYYGLNKVFDQNAKVVKDLNLDKIAADVLNDYSAYPMELFEDPNDPDKFLGFYVKWEEMDYFLLEFDIKNQSYKTIDLPELKKMDEYSVKLMYDGQFAGAFGTGASAISRGDKIIVTNIVFNDAYIYNSSLDSLNYKSWNGPLIGEKKTYIGPEQVEGQSSQHWETFKNVNEDINYGWMIWDDTNQRYYRFSTKQIFGEEKEEYGAYKAIGAEIFLSVYDKNFNLVAESLVPDLKKRLDKVFVKDGKIWIFENIDDEMGFIRLTVE